MPQESPFSSRPGIRLATPADTVSLRSLLYLGEHVYFFPGWSPLEAWLREEPCLVLERGRHITAALACPLETARTAWVRLFAVHAHVSPQRAWHLLWEAMQKELAERGVEYVMSLGIYGWLEELYRGSGFQPRTEVVTLAWEAPAAPLPPPPPHPQVTVRDMTPGDLDAVAEVDARAFPPEWRVSKALLRSSLDNLLLGLVAETEGRIVGHVLVLPTSRGCHIARLAVEPAWQARGVGRTLVTFALARAQSQGCRLVTVNTQVDNGPALSLYRRLGFWGTGQRHRVWRYVLPATTAPEIRQTAYPLPERTL